MKFFPKVLISLAITSLIAISLHAAFKVNIPLTTEKLVQLIEKDADKQAIAAVIKEGANPLARIPAAGMGDICAVQLAALLRAFTSLQALLDLGYAIDSKVEPRGLGEDYSALVLVIRDSNLTAQEKEQAVAWLLEHNASPNYVHFRGAPLIDAAALNLPSIVKLLLEYGADPDLVVEFIPGVTIRDSKISQGTKSFRSSLNTVSPEVRKVWENYQAQQKQHKKK